MTVQECEFLRLVRAFDERGGWLKWGSTNCAEWLHWRCDLSLSAAREKVRVAHALRMLPEVSEAFAAGRLSYSKVRALTRVANRVNESELVAFALQVSAAIVEQRCQQMRNALPDSDRIARGAYGRRALSAFRNPSRGAMTLTVELPLEEGELVLNALDRLLAEMPEAGDASTSYRARQADALISLCREVLSADGPSAAAAMDDPSAEGSAPGRSCASSEAYQVVVHVDEWALSGHDPESHPSAEGQTPGSAQQRSDLPIETVRRLGCDGSVVRVRNDAEGTPLDVGRKRRTVPTLLKRAVLSRDRHCRFPGCTHTRFVDAHHIQHWAHGGETRLDNLMLLCGHHHRLVHEGGFQICMDAKGHPFFRRPDGRAVPMCGFT